jgi:hypothetical protein
VGGCTRRSTPGFLFCGSDLVASGPSKIAQGKTGEKKFRKGFPKQVAKQLRHEAKSQRKLGKTELEGEIAQRDRIRPTRQVPSQLIWRDRETVKFERAAGKTADRGIPMDSEEHVL